MLSEGLLIVVLLILAVALPSTNRWRARRRPNVSAYRNVTPEEAALVAQAPPRNKPKRT